MTKEKAILIVQRSWWNYFWYFFSFFLIVPPFIAITKRFSLRLYIFENRLVLERGILSKHIKELFLRDIRTIDIKQTFPQRIVGIGNLMVATAGTSGYELVVKGIPDPVGLMERINSLRGK
ncbi:MAG: PH domain-containing protein [Deltaproteobacteria bacterium]|uniref:PH domain-containing protein n=1 Tax=Candidatus Zymogenus saltonus TaxID=2844893 RepID=A0A9D8KFZ6_9DELT|nr:PH domain-containing protein [Candidatus Zymogenus saltonus]